MPQGHSLLAGRNQQPLDEIKQRRVSNVFLGLDSNVPVRYDQHARTGFRIANKGQGDEYGEIVFGPDIYPGIGVLDPNSTLSMEAAAAHELAHYRRWRDLREIDDNELPELEELDEALASLEAILLYGESLSPADKRQLASDSNARLQRYLQTFRDRKANEAIHPK